MTATESDGDDVSLEVRIEDDHTDIVLEGDRDAAVVVQSASGERIYLPPEGFDAPVDADSPYQSAAPASPYQRTTGDSPYQSATDDSPYQSARQRMPEEGLRATATGFRIRHPEPVTDVRLLR